MSIIEASIVDGMREAVRRDNERRHAEAVKRLTERAVAAFGIEPDAVPAFVVALELELGALMERLGVGYLGHVPAHRSAALAATCDLGEWFGTEAGLRARLAFDARSSNGDWRR